MRGELLDMRVTHAQVCTCILLLVHEDVDFMQTSLIALQTLLSNPAVQQEIFTIHAALLVF